MRCSLYVGVWSQQFPFLQQAGCAFLLYSFFFYLFPFRASPFSLFFFFLLLLRSNPCMLRGTPVPRIYTKLYGLRLTPSLLISKSHCSHYHSVCLSHCFPHLTFRRSVAFSGRVHSPHEDLVDRVCFKTLLLRNTQRISCARSHATVRVCKENRVLQTTENSPITFYITSFPRTIRINLTTSFVHRCVCTRSARGVSAKTQMLLTATFLARYTDLITGELFPYTLSDKLLCGSVGATNLDGSLCMLFLVL